MPARWPFLLVSLGLALPACSALATGDRLSSEVAKEVASLTEGTRCRVTLRPTSHMASESQLTYEGTVSSVTSKEMTLDDAVIEATSREAQAIKTRVPFIDRRFSSQSLIRQSLDTPVTIDVSHIERVVLLQADSDVGTAD